MVGRVSRTALVASFAVLAAVSTEARANLLINGDFEASSSQTTTPPGWTNIGHEDGVIAYSTFGTPAYNGSYYYDIGGFGSPTPAPGDGIQQSVATVIGQTYKLTFGYSGENQSGTEILDINIGNSLSQITLFTDGSGTFQRPFTTAVLSYTATSSFTNIAFTVDSGSSSFGSNDPLIDGVSFVSAVPLPASAPMFGAALLGLAGLGYAAKRKKVAAAA